MLTAPPFIPIMIQLRDSTKSLHDLTEHGEFNKKLVQGRLPLESYIECLGQLFLIHRVLERELCRHRGTVAVIGAVLRDYQLQEPYLRSDLAYFGQNPDDIRPLPVTAAFLAHIERTADDCPTALLGIHYVFEGSNNGSKFISRAVRRAYSLTELNGTHYLDPYGERQREYWEAFKADMNAQEFSPEEALGMVQAAAATFEAVMRLHHELDAHATPAPAL